MAFTKHNTTYGRRPAASETSSPYERAKRAWDERIGTARVQAFHWRLVALTSLVGMLGLGIALAYASIRKDVKTYVVELSEIGKPARVTLVKRPDQSRVRPELRRRCMTQEGYWMPKSVAGRRILHITDRLARVIESMGLGEDPDWVFMNEAGNQVAENKTLQRLKRYALAGRVLVETHPKTGKPWSLLRWHWLRHYHRTRAHVSKIRREVSKLAMGHAADGIHDHYRGVDGFAFHEEYAKFDSGLNDDLIGTC